jgi:protein SCO1/2
MMRSGLSRWIAGAALAAPVALALSAYAHNGVIHKSAEEAAQHLAETMDEQAPKDLGPALPFPVDITAEFDLIDQTGAPKTQADYLGKPTLIFFGYANCEAICSVALPRMAEALDLLGEEGGRIQPLLITVDPARDTPEAMREALPRYHPRLQGLTGSEEALAAARAAFQVEATEVGYDPLSGPIFAHGSFIYMLGEDGKVATLLPPILGPERMAEIVRKYL